MPPRDVLQAAHQLLGLGIVADRFFQRLRSLGRQPKALPAIDAGEERLHFLRQGRRLLAAFLGNCVVNQPVGRRENGGILVEEAQEKRNGTVPRRFELVDQEILAVFVDLQAIRGALGLGIARP